MSKNNSKEFKVDSASLKHVRSFAREVLDKIPETEKNREDIILALSEATQNVVKHAYNGKTTDDLMRLDIEFDNNVLTINLFDKGNPVIPSNIKPRRLDDVKPGGLGTFFIGEIMDEITFKINKQNWVNQLILKKKI